MTTSSSLRALPAEVADVLEPELPALSREIVLAIGREVPEYARPFEGAFGRAVRTGVTEALHRFFSLIRDPDAADEAGRRLYIGLGRQEYREGRTLDALQAAYRIGARVAWRHLARAGSDAAVDGETMALLAEAIFAYIDELSAESVEGYAQAQSERAGELERARSELLAALLRGAAPPDSDLALLSAAARWALPRRAAALACSIDVLPALARRLGGDVLHAPHANLGCVVVPDAEGPGRREALRVAARDRRAAVGPEGTLAQLPRSWRLACETLSMSESAANGGPGELVAADDHLAQLVLRESSVAIERIAERRLRALADLTPASRERMALTALAFLQRQGNAAAVARALQIHPQTARYRIARLRELLGDQLDDPGARFELEAALRVAVSNSDP
ncbi:MAG TPA: helix-turn-helix domain-containing protein [Solirubrobacteraceae bacterium]|nr:helix-turn-helix domain-containing protein [Solirubrobacteraceae bacterium]